MSANVKSWISIAVVGVILGCADSHLVRQGERSGAKLSKADAVYIAVSRDGVYGTDTYHGSGVTTSQLLLSSFAKQVRNVEVARSAETYDEALKAARAKGFKYLVYPTILHWEDRATEWSAIPDRVEVKVEVVDLSTDKAIDTAIISGKSGIATLGGDHPQDLLPKPIEEFVASLY